MKVLHISAGAVWGGVERMQVTLARQRRYAPEMYPHFAVCFRERFHHELRMAGVPVDYLGEVRASSPYSIRNARRALRTVLVQEKIDIAICHLPWAHAMFAPVLREAGLPVVFWMHGFAADGGWLGLPWTELHWTELWAKLTPPALVIANSHATARTASRLFPGTRTEVLYCPVDFDAEARAEVPGTILQVSRMEPWKGHVLHLQALALLRDEPGWQCRIVGGVNNKGETAYLAKLYTLAQHLGIADRVEFLGERSDIGQQLAEAAIFCQPNTGPEPFGIVFIEALAAGVPVVTTRLGAAPEIITERCGVLTEPGSAESLANALRLLLKDSALRKRLGSEGPARAAALCSPAQQLPALSRLLQTAKLKGQPQ